MNYLYFYENKGEFKSRYLHYVVILNLRANEKYIEKKEIKMVFFLVYAFLIGMFPPYCDS